MKILQKLIWIFGTYILIGCSINSNGDIISEPPHCTFIRTEKNEFGRPTISITVENDSPSKTAYDVFVIINLKNGGYIVDDAHVNFGTLKKGESKTEEAHFYKLKSHSEYVSSDMEIGWKDELGGYY